MAKPPKQTLLTVLKIALLSCFLALMATSFFPVHPGTKQVNNLVFAQVNVQPNAQLSADIEPKNTSQPTEQKTQENSESSDENKPLEKVLIFIKQKGLIIRTIFIKWLPKKSIGLIIFIVFYFGVLWFRPLWLLLLPAELNIPKTPINFKLPPAVQHFLKYRPRVLDAWVAKHLETYKNKFLKNETVEDRKYYVSVPVQLDSSVDSVDSQEIYELTAETLSGLFSKEKRMRLLISGEGGSGKTTIACQIAKWAMEQQEQSKALAEHLMLPVLIEEEISNTGDGIKPIMEVIRKEIEEWGDNEQMIDELLVKQLLRKRRILLILDGYSEMDQETQRRVDPNQEGFPANALIVTSRAGKKFRSIDITIKTLRFDGGRLANFIDQYLEECNKRHLFEEQEEFFEECLQLARIIGEQKTITVLLAKLYADKMINSKENNSTSEGALDNIPDLILNHLEKLNRQVDRKDDNLQATLKEDAQLIAWKCLEQDYRPSYAERDEVVKAFEQLERKDATLCLDYFEDKLRLLKFVGYAKNKKDRDRIRFALDPLAEYLAALYLVQEKCKDDEEKWREFVAKVKEKSGKEEIKSFLLAVRDSCLAKGSEVRVPNFVADEIGELAGLDLEALEKDQERQRIKRLVRNLFAREATIQDRVDYLKKIGDSGSVAKFVALDIVKCLKDDDKEVRKSAAQALRKLSNASEVVVQALLALLQHEDPNVRLSAVEVLGNLRNASEVVVKAILALLQDEDLAVRFYAVEALKKLSNASETLLALLQNEHSGVRKSAVEALGKLGNGSEPVMQAILALLQDNSSLVRLVAAKALIELGNSPEPVTQALLALLRDNDSGVRSSAVEVLGNLGNASETVVQALLALLQDENTRVRFYTARALGNLGNASKPVVQALLALLQDEDSWVRRYAVEELGNLGNASEPVVQALSNSVQDSDSFVRSSAAKALKKLGINSELSED